MRKENLLLETESLNGIQRVYKFQNGYGASVIKHDGSKGHEYDLWELAVLIFCDDYFEVCYDTEITDYVIGWLTEDMVDEILNKIEKL